MSDSAPITVTVVHALPGQAHQATLSLAEGGTVLDALVASGVLARAGLRLTDLAGMVGIWGQPVALDQPLADGDRVEIWRPLTIDPMQARRLRAAARKTTDSGQTR